MTCQHLEALRGLRAQLNALDLDVDCGAVIPPLVDPQPKPFFGGRWAPWAIKSKQIGDHPQAEKFLAEFLLMCSGEANLNTHDWAIAKREFDDNTPWTAGLEIDRHDWCNLKNGDRIPWHPDWKHGTDGDSYFIIYHAVSGHCYRIWKTRYDKDRNIMRCGTASIVTEDYKSRDMTPANMFTKSNAFHTSRAGGFALGHMLPTREEMDRGLIPHCLALALPKPSRGRRFAPATKHIGGTGSPGTGRLGTGVRIAFDGLTDDDLGNWLQSFPVGIGRYMQPIGRAVRDYGFLLVDNGGNGKRGSVYFENNLTADWDSLGLTKDVMQQSLYGLLKPNLGAARILAEPEFPGGDMNEMARYADVDYPEDLG